MIKYNVHRARPRNLGARTVHFCRINIANSGKVRLTRTFSCKNTITLMKDRAGSTSGPTFHERNRVFTKNLRAWPRLNGYHGNFNPVDPKIKGSTQKLRGQDGKIFGPIMWSGQQQTAWPVHVFGRKWPDHASATLVTKEILSGVGQTYFWCSSIVFFS